jgi:histidinol-phosphatase
VTHTDDLELALSMADAADRITMDRFGALDLLVETKPDLTPVSEADMAAEMALRQILAQARPDDGILGEEFGITGDPTARQWILDPIDGTKSYVRGVPVWATLIALVEGGDVVVGVVSAPALGRRWWAATGSGAWGRMLDRDPVPLHVSSVQRIEDASFSYSDAIGWDSLTTTGLNTLLTQTWRQRAYGDFWSHIMVAEGVVDIAAEPELGPWDIAALVPIVTEAGGRVSAFDGSPAIAGGCAISTNRVLHDTVLAIVNVDSNIVD